MNLISDLVLQIIAMILMVAVGFLFSRLHIMSSKESRVLTQTCVYALNPCMLFNSFQSDLNSSQLSGMALAFVAAVAIHFVVIWVAKLFRKTPLAMVPGEEASAIYCNTGNFVVPMIYGLASLGASYVFYPAAFMLVQTTLLWSHGVMLVGRDSKIKWKKILLNPCMIGVLLGLICFFLQIRISGPLSKAVTSLGACLGPISMIVVGVLLGEQNLKKVLSDIRIYRVAAIRLIIFPLFAMGVLWLLSLVWHHDDLINILTAMFLCVIGPAASTITQIAQLYKSPDTAYVSAINVVTVVLCALTMPLMVMLFSWVMGIA